MAAGTQGLLKNARHTAPMFDARRQIRLLGHMCGVTGVAIGADTIFGKFSQNYMRLFPYGMTGILISIFMIVVGARVLSEGQWRNWKGPKNR
jgi:hypothetical protein